MRAGNYRVTVTLESDKNAVTVVLRVRHRREAYDQDRNRYVTTD